MEGGSALRRREAQSEVALGPLPTYLACAMHLPDLVDALRQFGPLAVLVGAGFEGQTAVIAGGALSQRGLIPLPVVVGSACAGSAIMDQALFLIGRRGRSSRFVTRIASKPAFARALGFIGGRPVLFTLSFRFIFGLRAAGPVALGVTRLNGAAFALLNLIGAVIWAGAFAAIGFLSTGALFSLHAHLRGPVAAGAALAAGAAMLVFLRRRHRRKHRLPHDDRAVDAPPSPPLG
jgi:membrane protein DedA with SNARE-associated domain